MQRIHRPVRQPCSACSLHAHHQPSPAWLTCRCMCSWMGPQAKFTLLSSWTSESCVLQQRREGGSTRVAARTRSAVPQQSCPCSPVVAPMLACPCPSLPTCHRMSRIAAAHNGLELTPWAGRAARCRCRRHRRRRRAGQAAAPSMYPSVTLAYCKLNGALGRPGATQTSGARPNLKGSASCPSHLRS